MLTAIRLPRERVIVNSCSTIIRVDEPTPVASRLRGMRAIPIGALIGLLCGWITAHVCHAAEPATRPNIVILLADDMGYSDLGCYGGEIETPNLDALAKNGLRFTQFYNTARCWPTRGALLTGYYAQQIRRDTVPGVPKSGSAGTRPAWARLLPEMLKPSGYRTYHSGKWHVDGEPVQNGFDHSYCLQDSDRYFYPTTHSADGEALPPVAHDAGYYATTAIADHAVKCLREHAAQHGDQPFFQYVAFIAPHFPLHALQQDIARYRDKYRAGWDQMREQRWRRMTDMGIIQCTLSAAERDVGPPYDFPAALEKLGAGEINRPLPWSELTERTARLSVGQDGRARGDGGSHGSGDRQNRPTASRDGRAREHVDLLSVGQWRERRDHGARRRPRSSGPARIGRVVFVPGAGLVHLREHALAPAQDLGVRGRHCHAADRPLAARDHVRRQPAA